MNFKSQFLLLPFLFSHSFALMAQDAPDIADATPLCSIGASAHITFRASILFTTNKNHRELRHRQLENGYGCRLSPSTALTAGQELRVEANRAYTTTTRICSTHRVSFDIDVGGRILSVACTDFRHTAHSAPPNDARRLTVSDFRRLFGSLTDSTHNRTPFFESSTTSEAPDLGSQGAAE